MIEKMKMVHIVSSASRKEDMLDGLREIGVMHIAERKDADKAVTENFTKLFKTSMMLKEYQDPKAELPEEILSDEAFEKLYAEVRDAVEKQTQARQIISADSSEIDRIQSWGDFSPGDVKYLSENGIDLHFYRLTKQQSGLLDENEDIKYIRLADCDGMATVASLGKLPKDIAELEFDLPQKSMSEYEAEVEEAEAVDRDCEKVFEKAALYEKSFIYQIIRAKSDQDYSSAEATVENEEGLVWISGYVPETELDRLKAAASANGWAWAAEDVGDDDEHVPTKVVYNKVSKLIKPLFDILGILPGYREQDVSLWFFLFFILFFAMIIGDGGYGLIILIGTIALWIKSRKMNDVIFLLLVLSVATIVWGAVTGTWFGMEAAMKVPFLKAMVIPNFANYPEYFNVTATAQQNTIMKFSFTIGAIQMALGSLLSIRKKIPEKDLSWIADLGWIIAIMGMYLLSLYLVIGENIPVKPVFMMIITAYLIAVFFGGMSPDKTFAQGLKSGLADAFTNFLNTISCFGNVMSYIRLFAVGMAGLAISQSFNSMAAGFTGPLLVAGVIIVLIGHGLNIVMCFLSVIVHGVRLNVLEFSGQAGIEWTGIAYDPFMRDQKLRK